MTDYLLDTDTVTHLRSGHVRVSAEFLARPAGTVGTTVITVEEQLTGWYSLLRRPLTDEETVEAYDQLARSARWFGRVQVVSFDLGAIARYRLLKRLRLNVGNMDLRIAAIALEHGCTVVTRNLRDFRRVPGLTCEDWSA